MSSGITDLKALLASATPMLAEGRFVYVAVGESRDFAALEPICIFREAEAITIICTVERAELAGFKSECVFRQITLQVHSSLAAVGFLAAVSAALADAGIPCNAVSAFYHDHIFVPEEKAEQAIEVLSKLAHGSKRPNQSPEPTVMSVTPRADARVAPATTVAHL